MKTTKPFFLLFFLFLSPFMFAQDWEKTFQDTIGWGKGFDATQTSDNGYVMVGDVDWPTGAIRHYIWLVKTDSDGNTLWSHVYNVGKITNQTGRAVIEGAGGDLFVVGSNNSKAYVLKTNADGDSLWIRNFGGQGINSFQDVALDDQGNLILVGQYEEEFNSGLHEVWAMGMSTAGDSLWSVRYLTPSSSGSAAWDIHPISANDFLITGNHDGQALAMQIDGSNGAMDWSKTYQFSTGNFLYSGAPNKEGTNFLLGGKATGIAGFFPILLETNLTGDITDTLGFSSVNFGAITSLTPTLDSGFILTGSSFDFWSQFTEVGFITKLDANYQVEWELTFPDSLTKQGASIRQFTDGSIIIAGSRQDGMWLKRIMGNTTSSKDLLVENSFISLYPNPASETIHIELDASIAAEQVSISIYDSLGRLMAKKDFNNPIFVLDVAPLPKGIYHFTVNRNKFQIGKGKFMVR